MRGRVRRRKVEASFIDPALRLARSRARARAASRFQRAQALASIKGSPAAPSTYHGDALLQGPRGGVFFYFEIVSSSRLFSAVFFFFFPFPFFFPFDLIAVTHNSLTFSPPLSVPFQPSGASVRNRVCSFCVPALCESAAARVFGRRRKGVGTLSTAAAVVEIDATAALSTLSLSLTPQPALVSIHFFPHRLRRRSS